MRFILIPIMLTSNPFLYKICRQIWTFKYDKERYRKIERSVMENLLHD